jgi:hypothetical protein
LIVDFWDVEGGPGFQARRNQIAGVRREDGERRRRNDIAILEMQSHGSVLRRENRMKGLLGCLADRLVRGCERHLIENLLERLRLLRQGCALDERSTDCRTLDLFVSLWRRFALKRRSTMEQSNIRTFKTQQLAIQGTDGILNKTSDSNNFNSSFNNPSPEGTIINVSSSDQYL